MVPFQGVNPTVPWGTAASEVTTVTSTLLEMGFLGFRVRVFWK